MLQVADFTHRSLLFTEDAEARLAECIELVNTKRPDLEENLRRQFFGYNGKLWEEHPSMRMRVMSDFAPLSFYFIREVVFDGAWERDYNGGIIFHGSHDGGGDGGAPTFSVNLSPVDGWATHT